MAIREWFEGFDGFPLTEGVFTALGMTERAIPLSYNTFLVVPSNNRPGNRIQAGSSNRVLYYPVVGRETDFWCGASLECTDSGNTSVWVNDTNNINFIVYLYGGTGAVTVEYNPSGTVNDIPVQTVAVVAPACEHLIEVGWLASSGKVEVWCDNIKIFEKTGITLPVARPYHVVLSTTLAFVDNVYMSASRQGDRQMGLLSFDTDTVNTTTPQPNYGYYNPVSRGNRNSIITLTTTLTGFTGPLTKLLDGSRTGNTSYIYTSSGNNGKGFEFVLSQPQSIKGFTWYQHNGGGHGLWQWQWSIDDGVTWLNSGETFTLGGATVTERIEPVSPPLTTHYRLWMISGNINASSYLNQIEFLANVTDVDVLKNITDNNVVEFAYGVEEEIEISLTNSIPAVVDNISAVKVIHRARKTDSGLVTGDIILTSSTANVVDNVVPPIGYGAKDVVLTTDPATGLAFDRATLDTLTIGIKESTP